MKKKIKPRSLELAANAMNESSTSAPREATTPHTNLLHSLVMFCRSVLLCNGQVGQEDTMDNR